MPRKTAGGGLAAVLCFSAPKGVERACPADSAAAAGPDM